MKRKIQKWMMALMCGIMMMGYVFSAQASDHPCMPIEVLNSRYDHSYEPNGDNHIVKYYVEYICQTCNRAMGNTNEAKRTEGHNYNRYRDLGHQGKHDHRYELYCGLCGGGSQIVTITTCDVETVGRHTTPW